MTPTEVREEYNKRYDRGFLNHIVRFWFYLQRGLDLVNQFKYLLAGIVAVYYTLKLENIYWLIALFAISIPVLTVTGWFHTHKMAKAMEWTGMVFSSYFGRRNMDLQEKNVEYTERNVKLLEEIRDLLKNHGK